MYSHILVPLAFDEEHQRGAPAIAEAVGLLAEGGRISLLHVAQPVAVSFEGMVPDGFDERFQNAMRSRLAEVAAAAEEKHGISPATELAIGSPAGEVVRFAEKTGCDLILIDSHRPGFSKFLLGSTAAQVVRNAGCSVLVLRGKAA